MYGAPIWRSTCFPTQGLFLWTSSAKVLKFMWDMPPSPILDHLVQKFQDKMLQMLFPEGQHWGNPSNLSSTEWTMIQRSFCLIPRTLLIIILYVSFFFTRFSGMLAVRWFLSTFKHQVVKQFDFTWIFSLLWRGMVDTVALDGYHGTFDVKVGGSLVSVIILFLKEETLSIVQYDFNFLFCIISSLPL